jgi:hypothetical protein
MNCRAGASPAGLIRVCPAQALPSFISVDYCQFVVNPTCDLVAALRERLAIIGDESSRRDVDAHTARLRAISEKIDNFAAALPKPIDPQLAHFLQRKSYDKALELLDGTGSTRAN